MKKGCVRVRNIMRVVQTIDLKTYHFRSYDVTIQTVENFFFEQNSNILMEYCPKLNGKELYLNISAFINKC